MMDPSSIAKCVVCGGVDATPVDAPVVADVAAGTAMAYRRCRSCGLVYLSPQPDDRVLAGYYGDDYGPYVPAVDELPGRLQRLDQRYGLAKRGRHVMRFRQTGSILDVGCATGVFLDQMRKAGRWKVSGVETSRSAAEYATRKLGIDVHVGELASARWPDHSFDVITMWNVLEHLRMPEAELRESRRLLRPGGVLVISTPNPECLDARVFGRHWVAYDNPRHLYLFAPSVIARMLADRGFRVVSTKCLYGARYHISASLQSASKSRSGTGARRGLAWAVAAASRVVVPVLASLEHNLGFGPVLTYVATAPPVEAGPDTPPEGPA